MRGHAVSAGHLWFSTKEQAKQHFQRIIHSYDIGSVIDDAGHIADITAILGLHRDRDAKLGCGMSAFSVISDPWGRPCFAISRLDGSTTDFSFYECISPVAPKTKFRGALRCAVAPDIITARNAYLERHGPVVPCAVTGAALLPKRAEGEVHIDHRCPNTFDAIADRFSSDNNLTDFLSLLAPHQDNAMADRLADDALAAVFRRLHWQLAELDFVSRAVNLGIAAKAPRPGAAHIVLREWIRQP